MGDFIMLSWLKYSDAFKCNKKLWWESDSETLPMEKKPCCL